MNKKEKQKRAFTLAEVLITLGVIGVVAAITIPVLIQKHNNHVVETKLKKVYSVMNQAIQMAETEYGPKEQWDFADPNFWNKYFAPYVKVLKTEQTKDNNYTYNKIYFPDGSLMLGKYLQITKDENNNEIEVMNVGFESNSDYFFYPNAKNFDMETFSNYSESGRSFFMFRFAQNVPGDPFHYRKGFEPYGFELNNDFSNLYSGYMYSCNENSTYKVYCTKAIQINGWKIPKDYPFKVR